MEILNKKERVRAFLSFIIIFMITVGIIITAVFYNMEIPKKNNKVLKKENSELKKQLQFEQYFSQKIDSIKPYINDSISSLDINYYVRIAEQKLVNLKASLTLSDDKNVLPSLYTNTIDAYSEIINMKQQLRSYSDKSRFLDSLTKENMILKENERILKEQLNNCLIMQR